MKSFEEIFAEFEKLPKGATALDAIALMTEPRAENLESARSVCALVRRIDAGVYSFLTADISGSPEWSEVVEAFPSDFQRVPPDAWEMGPVRERLLAQWVARNQGVEFRDWNRRLFDYFSKLSLKSAEIEAVYHGAAATEPDKAIPYFEACFQHADDLADFSHCHALVEALNAQIRFRGPKVSELCDRRSRYLQTRLYFLEPLRKTKFFVRRKDAEKDIGDMIDRPEADTSKPWIFHIHATGGLGKTTLLNRLIARDLVPRTVPVARLDFDDPEVQDVLVYPMRLLSTILGQWTQQMGRNLLSSSADLLESAKETADWNPGILADVRLDLKGANIQDPMLVVLDTLEDVTLLHRKWLATCIETLSEIHAEIPKLTVILSGRYNLQEKGQVLTDVNSVVYELPYFTTEEGADYLKLRGITDSSMQSAIMNRAHVQEVQVLAPKTAQSMFPLKLVRPPKEGLNPFKLALMAEIVLDRTEMTPEDVLKLPSVEIAYLMERVILRITSQPLRWVIRYASIARTFTSDFLEKVLLPPLRAALGGTDQDLSAKQSEDIQKYLGAEIPWKPQPKEAANVTASGLWSSLEEYARERGWITLSEGKDVLQLHSEIIEPTRLLLRDEPVRITLQTAARDYYLGLWTSRKTRGVAALGDALEALYHAQELQGAGAAELWRTLIREAEADGLDSFDLALEPTRYRDPADHSKPRFEEWYCEAYIKCAELKAKVDGVFFSKYSTNWSIFVSYLEAVKQVRPDLVPRYLTVVLASAGLPTDSLQAQALEQGLTSVKDPAEQFWLHQQAARAFDLAAKDHEAEAHWLNARKFCEQAGIATWRVDSEMARFYSILDQYSKAVESYKLVRANAPPEERGRATVKLCDWALDHCDLPNAHKYIKAVPTSVPAFDQERLKFRIALAGADESLQTQYESLLKAANPLNGAHPAEISALEGEYFAFTLDFSRAQEAFRLATKGFESLGDQARADQCRLREIEFAVFDMASDDAEFKYADWANSRIVPTPLMRARIARAGAFLLLNQGKTDEAKARIADALSPELPPRARWIGTLFALAYEIHPNPPTPPEIARFLNSLEPVEVVAEAFDCLEFRSETSGQLAGVADAIEFWINHHIKSPDRISLFLLQREHLTRLASEGSSWLTGAAPESLRFSLAEARHLATLALYFRALEVAESRELKLAISYRSLLGAIPAEFAGLPLTAFIKSKAALELAADHKIDEARKLAEEAIAVWEKQPASRRKRQVMEVRGRLTPLMSGPLNPFPELEVSVLPHEAMLPQWDVQSSGPAGKFADEGQTNAVLTGMFGPDFLRFELSGELTKMAPPASDGQLVTSVGQAALPWEFSVHSKLFCRSVKGSPPAPRAAKPAQRRILVIKPSTEEEALSFNIGSDPESGFSVEHLYQNQLSPQEVFTMEEPQPKELREAIGRLYPAVVHLIGQLYEGATGVTLDFQGSGRRYQERLRGVKSARLESRLDPERLTYYLEGQCPFVILDITRPENITDAARMLLLRNRYAAELFRSGQVAGVLAAGLQNPYDRMRVSTHLVGGIVRGENGAYLWSSQRPAGEPADLPDAISRFSTALFCYSPFRPILPSR